MPLRAKGEYGGKAAFFPYFRFHATTIHPCSVCRQVSKNTGASNGSGIFVKSARDACTAPTRKRVGGAA